MTSRRLEALLRTKTCWLLRRMDRSVGTGELRQAKKSEQREVARVREMISNKQQHIPVTELIGHINRHLRGWKGLLRFP